MSYLMGLIEGTPNHEFVLGFMQGEIKQALDIFRKECAFVQHAQ